MEILNWKDVQHVNDICVMAPTLQLAEKAEMLIKQENYQNIDVVVAASGRQETVKCAQTLAAAGAEIIITRKGTRRIVEEVTNLKVVSLNNSLSDYLWMLKERGLHTPGLIAFFSYDPMSSDILQMCEMLEVQTKNYIFKSFADCRGCVERALKDGAVFSVGGAWTDPWAKRLGLPHVIVENSVETILNALESATQLRRVQVEEAEKQCLFKTQSEMYQAVLDFTHDAILAIDENGRIQVLNPPAERIMGCRAADSVGQPVEAVQYPSAGCAGERREAAGPDHADPPDPVQHQPDPHPGGRPAPGRSGHLSGREAAAEQRTEDPPQVARKGLGGQVRLQRYPGGLPSQIARSYAASRASVLILGETGTGKELFPQSIHNASDRRDGPFVAINCAAVSNSLLESELFGYEAGSFTGASRGGREGVFELAHGGTLFLDEIGEIPRETQVELLRVLQEKEIRRVGGSRVIPVDVRIIAATNKDLLQETVEGRFREDLYYRLDVLDLKLPPLRERGDDVKILGLHLFRQLPGGKDPIMQSQFLYLLEQVGPYQWYGNIRELQNFVERANILMRNAGASSVTVSDILRRRAEPAPEPCQETESRDRRAIEAALHNHPGSMADAARSLGCSRQTLWRKMKKYGIQR